MAKKKDLKELSVAELEKDIRDTEDKLVSLRLRKQTGQVEKPHQLKELRKHIARLKTNLNQKKQVEKTAA
jgi:large subunit ribosomal protein L29